MLSSVVLFNVLTKSGESKLSTGGSPVTSTVEFDDATERWGSRFKQRRFEVAAVVGFHLELRACSIVHDAYGRVWYGRAIGIENRSADGSLGCGLCVCPTGETQANRQKKGTGPAREIQALH